MRILAVAAVIVMQAAIARAGGLVVPGTGTEAMGRAGAFAAKADDPSALHHNPAGFAKLTGTVIYLGANVLDYALTFDRDGVYGPTGDGEPPAYVGEAFAPVSNGARPALGLGRLQAIPLFVVASDLGGVVPDLRVAFGVMAPNAYPNRDFGDYEYRGPDVPPPPQRYDVVKQEALVVLPSLAASYSIGDRLDVGVRVSWGLASMRAVSYVWAVQNHDEWIDYDGEFEVDVSDSFTTAFDSAPVPVFALGALYRPIAAVEVGASYTSPILVRGEGTGTARLAPNPLTGEPEFIAPLGDDEGPVCRTGGTVEALATCVDFGLPQTARVAARWIAARGSSGAEIADVELDVVWEDWSAVSDFSVVVDGKSETLGRYLEKVSIRHGLKDSVSLRLGGSYALPLAERAVIVRAGVAHDTAAAPDSWQRVDFDSAARTTLAAGATWRGSRFRVDVAGAVALEGARAVPACHPTAAMPGCPPGSGETARAERDAPDALIPILSPEAQPEHPFNGGDYASRYLMFSVGVSTWF